jgi:histidine ammonia-lyase
MVRRISGRMERNDDYVKTGLIMNAVSNAHLGVPEELAPVLDAMVQLVTSETLWRCLHALDGAEHYTLHQSLLFLTSPSTELHIDSWAVDSFPLGYAHSVWILLQAKKLSMLADFIGCISLDAFDCRMDPFNLHIHKARPHQGQIETAAFVLETLKGSEIYVQEKTDVQDPYSFRCIPQVHGASKDAIRHIEEIVTTEINSVTDNPNIFPDDDMILSGGNFHGQPLAINLDFLAIALAELGSISERRTYLLMTGQRGLPPYLIANPGVNSGLMIVQYTAAALASENKQLCTPASVDTIISSNGQEDHVSMGANAATKCYRVLENLEAILAIELLSAAQAMEFRRPKRSSKLIDEFLAEFRKEVSFNENDRVLSDDIHKTIEFLRLK